MKLIKAIPSALTCANLICGFLVFIVDIDLGIWLVLLGALFDVFDGATARILHAQSELGAQLDSLADVVTFGAAPAFLVANELDGNLQYFASLILVFAALRLAKFNISGGETYYFKGLAVPASAMFILGVLIFMQESFLLDELPFLLICLAIAALNASSIKMFSFKGLKKDKYTKWLLILTAFTAVVSLIIFWPYALGITMLVYVILSIVYHFLMSTNTVST